MRESFALTALAQAIPHCTMTYQMQTDIILEVARTRYAFEIGGKNKQYMASRYTVQDDVSLGADMVIPLRMFGLLV